MKTPIVLYQRCTAKVSYFWLIRDLLHATVVTKNPSKDPQRNGTNHGTDIIYLLGCNYLLQYEVETTVSY